MNGFSLALEGEARVAESATELLVQLWRCCPLLVQTQIARPCAAQHLPYKALSCGFEPLEANNK